MLGRVLARADTPHTRTQTATAMEMAKAMTTGKQTVAHTAIENIMGNERGMEMGLGTATERETGVETMQVVAETETESNRGTDPATVSAPAPAPALVSVPVAAAVFLVQHHGAGCQKRVDTGTDCEWGCGCSSVDVAAVN